MGIIAKEKIESLKDVLNTMANKEDLTSFEVMEMSIQIDEFIIEYYSK